MQVVRIDDGLWRWTVAHPDWKPGAEWEPRSAACTGKAPTRSCSSILRFRRRVPTATRFFEALDRDVERVGNPVVVLTTCIWHARSADELSAALCRARGRAPRTSERYASRRACRRSPFRSPTRSSTGSTEPGRSSPATALLGDDSWRRQDVPAELARLGWIRRQPESRACARLSSSQSNAFSCRTASRCSSGGRRRARSGLGLSDVHRRRYAVAYTASASSTARSR